MCWAQETGPGTVDLKAGCEDNGTHETQDSDKHSDTKSAEQTIHYPLSSAAPYLPCLTVLGSATHCALVSLPATNSA